MILYTFGLAHHVTVSCFLRTRSGNGNEQIEAKCGEKPADLAWHSATARQAHYHENSAESLQIGVIFDSLRIRWN